MPFTPRRQLRRARELRRDQTSAEARLWAKLRDRRMLGYKFVRQEPIGPFITDFVCREARLVVEVDGATHSTDEEVARDGRRSACFASQGYRVVRVLNDDVYRRLDDVLATILAGLKGDRSCNSVGSGGSLAQRRAPPRVPARRPSSALSGTFSHAFRAGEGKHA